jgi:hypothetical protein
LFITHLDQCTSQTSYIFLPETLTLVCVHTPTIPHYTSYPSYVVLESYRRQWNNQPTNQPAKAIIAKLETIPVGTTLVDIETVARGLTRSDWYIYDDKYGGVNMHGRSDVKQGWNTCVMSCSLNCIMGQDLSLSTLTPLLLSLRHS